jgi:hypothetical protein
MELVRSTARKVLKVMLVWQVFQVQVVDQVFQEKKVIEEKNAEIACLVQEEKEIKATEASQVSQA